MYYNFSENKFSENKFTKNEGDFMFYGRKKEINELTNYLNKNSAILIYGVRRVGKTSLIKETIKLENRKFIYYECIKASELINVSFFIELLKKEISFPNIIFNDFLSIFEYLNNNYSDYIFVIDEYSYLKEYYLTSKKKDSYQEALRIDSSFQKIIDEYLSNNSLILCGSSLSIMKDLIEYNSPLYDRFKYVLNLKEFSYNEIKDFFPNYSNKQLVEIYSIFGGSPNVLNKIDTNEDLFTNIKKLILDDNSKIRNHISLNILNEFNKDNDLSLILNVIKNGAKSYTDIATKCNLLTTGLLDKKLKKLIDLDLIEKIYPINMENNNKKSLYEIKDNLLKFYYTYVYGKESFLNLYSADRYFDEFINKSLNEFISRRFERIVRDYFQISIKKGFYGDIINVGSYFSDNNEFDCVLKRKDFTYSVYEAKYYERPISLSIQQKEINQIKSIKGLKISEIGFIALNGFAEKIEGINYLEIDDLFINR